MFKSVIYIGLETISHGINIVVEKLENLTKLLNYDITIIKQEPLTDYKNIRNNWGVIKDFMYPLKGTIEQ